MEIGVPNESKDQEFRVGLSPSSVRVLRENGHAIFVETQAGSGAGFTDDEYQEAAMYSFKKYGFSLGEAIANIVTMIDGLVVIGGGISNSYDLFMPFCMEILQGKMKTYDGKFMPRLPVKFFDYENSWDYIYFLSGKQKRIKVPFSDKGVTYDNEKRIAIGKSILGTSKAVAIGAYAFAINQIDKKI